MMDRFNMPMMGHQIVTGVQDIDPRVLSILISTLCSKTLSAALQVLPYFNGNRVMFDLRVSRTHAGQLSWT